MNVMAVRPSPLQEQGGGEEPGAAAGGSGGAAAAAAPAEKELQRHGRALFAAAPPRLPRSRRVARPLTRLLRPPHSPTLNALRTVTVPASLARGALSFARLSRLFPLVEAYGAKRLDVATVDNDGTVIVRRAPPGTAPLKSSHFSETESDPAALSSPAATCTTTRLRRSLWSCRLKRRTRTTTC